MEKQSDNKSILDLKEKEAQFTKRLLTSVVHSLIAENVISPNNLSQKTIFEALEQIVDGKIELEISVDHTRDILKHSRKFSKENRYELAVLFYATFFEHKLNFFIFTRAKQKKLAISSIKDIIKSTNIRDKASWLLILLDIPAINRDILKIISKISEERNAFVHYKWSPVEDTPSNSDKEKIELLNAEKAAKYLMRYEARVLFKGTKAAARKLLSKTNR